MNRAVTATVLVLISFQLYSQFYTGYYVSDPQVHSFDHFKIKHEKQSDKLSGDLIIHAYHGRKELWEKSAQFVSDSEQRDYFISVYGKGKKIISVHVLKFMWDGNEWEYFLLGYIGEDKHRHFVAIEEIFNDETETRLLEINEFDWIKAHHIRSTGSK